MKFSIERQINPEHPFNKLGKYPFADYFFGNVKAVEAMDPTHRRVRPQGAARLVPGHPGRAGRLDREPDRGEEVRRRTTRCSPVGTGPFKYASWDRGQRVVLEKNPSYWRFPVKVDRVVYRPDRRGPGAADRAADRQRST